jgi:hypothetical protein
MTPPFDETKRQTLERLRAQKIKEYEAVIAQAGRTLEASTRLRLKEEADDLEKQIREIELDLAAIAKLDHPLAGDAEDVTPTPKLTGPPPSLGDALTIALEKKGRPYKAGPAQWWIRLKVESHQPVQECRGQIYDILKLENEADVVGKHLPAAQATILSWADGNFNPTSLVPYETQYLDLAWRSTGKPQFDGDEMRVASSRVRGLRAPESPAWGHDHDFIGLDPGYYLLVVRFLASGFAPLERRFRLHWPGPGKEDEILLTAVTGPPPTSRPDDTPAPGIIEMAVQFIKKWLWLQFLLSIVVPVVGFASNLGGVLDLSLPTRLTILILLVSLLGGAFLVIGSLPAQRANYQPWDRGLTALLLIAIVTIVIAQYPAAAPPGPPPSTPTTPLSEAITQESTTLSNGDDDMPQVALTEMAEPPEDQPSVHESEETAPSPEFVSLNCGPPHSPITGSEVIVGSVTIDSPTYSGACLAVTQSRLPLQIRWEKAAPDTEIWILVHSPLAKLYYPHYCVSIESPDGEQSCLAVLDRREAYDVLVVFADAAAHIALQDIASGGRGVALEGLPTGIRQMGHIAVVRE